MASLSEAHLKEIGLHAAQDLVGAERVEQVDVVAGADSSDEPAYFFSFLMHEGEDRQRAALIRTRLAQRIRDELIRRGDEVYPFVRVLRHEDWERHKLAQSV